MRISRFYLPETLASDTEVSLPPDTAHYIHNVLRLAVGTPVVLFNGDGNEYAGELTSVSKRAVAVLINAKLSLSCESPLSLHLAQGISKGDRMDFVLQKATELGVSDITPIITERCNVKLSAERWEKKAQSWHKIIASACAACTVYAPGFFKTAHYSSAHVVAPRSAAAVTAIARARTRCSRADWA
jgi:16S rRNA (uracil1498-N3)-methyltransferase